MKWSYEKLSLHVRAGLEGKDSALVAECILIARENMPAMAFSRAHRMAQSRRLDQFRASGVAKAARWLAVIRRDFGQQAFEETVSLLLSSFLMKD